MKLMYTIMIVGMLVLAGCVNAPVEEPSLMDEIEQIEQELESNDLVETPEEEFDVRTISVDENQELNLGVDIVDPDMDEVDYSFSAPLDSNGKWDTNYGDAGEYIVTITATDGVHTSTEDVNLVVNRVNVAPELSGVENIEAKEGDIIEFMPQAMDPNGDEVTMTVSAPLENGKFVSDHTSAGIYEIVVTATDGELTTTQTVSLIIEDVNVLPLIENVMDITVSEGETVTIEPVLSDLDNDELVLSINGPVGDDGVWETDFTDNGVYEITIRVDDGKDIVEKMITVTVEDINMAPEIVDIYLQ